MLARSVDGVDQLRLEVVPTPADAGGGFHVEIYVNGVEMTTAGAGLGMDTFDLLIPDNKLVATTEPRRVPVARCRCGVYGCGVTDIAIERLGDIVRWEWLVETPMDRAVEFNTADYDREIERVAADHGWETPERLAGRLVLEQVDRDHLASLGLTVSGACNDWRDPGVFTAWLSDPGRYQVIVDFPWGDLDPTAMANEVCRVLTHDSPDTWRARWHGNAPETRSTPPLLAGSRWTRMPI